jgi:hypothetical protein
MEFIKRPSGAYFVVKGFHWFFKMALAAIIRFMAFKAGLVMFIFRF